MKTTAIIGYELAVWPLQNTDIKEKIDTTCSMRMAIGHDQNIMNRTHQEEAFEKGLGEHAVAHREICHRCDEAPVQDSTVC
jgi:hypothetical protein